MDTSDTIGFDTHTQISITGCQCASARDHALGLSPCCSSDHWSYAIKQVRKSVLCTTAATITSPATFLVFFEKKRQREINRQDPHNLKQLETSLLVENDYAFNGDFLNSRDIFAYRRSRSEHLLFRLMHHMKQKDTNRTCVRISKGVFLVQQWDVSETLSMDFDYADSSDSSTSDINTFSFNGLYQEMISQTQHSSRDSSTDGFVPYTHTLGVRFTNPYQEMRDILVLGNIPLWCQTLLVTECMRHLPIRHGQTVYGLLPFAKEMGFQFGRLPHIERVIHQKIRQEPYPEMIVIFERFAMELVHPRMMLEDVDVDGVTWEEKYKAILDALLYCEIPRTQAAIITKLANEWAALQQIVL
ncbi:hypothetical protein A0J61_09399 [Choanephora cucurbitarum]|uniref:Uncharacterized protein n=1 Tax=Choanephora cucurbitarum TaxID=101091 RepID=A0A1C7N0L8_9FUNG|nr:hypothetical protein A0J61_09399 [Choanephora cucurbitarum]